MKRANVTYEELAVRLKDHGLTETRDLIAAKLKRGTFAATFLLACLAALELDGVRLETFKGRGNLKSTRYANTGFLSLLLATLIFLVSLSAFKLSIDEYNAQKQYLAAEHHTENEVAREATVLGFGAEGWTAIFTGGLFLFTMALAVFTYRLFRVTKDGIAEQAALTRQSLDHASRSARAAEDAIETANLSSERQLRAYVLIETVVVDKINPTAGSGFIAFKNYGQTPAKDVVVRLYSFNAQVPVDQLSFPNRYPHASDKLTPPYMLGPQAHNIVTFVFYNLAFAVSEGAQAPFLQGVAEYVDIFGRQRKTLFCLIFNKNLVTPTFNTWTCGNDII